MMGTLRMAAFAMFIGIFVWKVNALALLSVSKYDGKPLVNERFSINGGRSNEIVIPREVINHVRHKHEQTIGNIHISTNIDIANTITILNTSAPTTSQSSNATVLTLLVPGSAIDADSRQRDPASINGQQQFGRPIRNQERNQGDDYKPLVFPKSSFMPENSRNVRFPTERHSIHAIDSEASAAAVNPIRSMIVFPRSDMKSENELATLENAKIEPVVSIAIQTNVTNEPLLPNTVNMSVFVANQTAIENGFEPMLYIDDDGVFRVKYVTKGENVSASSAKQQHSNEQSFSLASINKTEETAIISNDNRQILQDHRIPNKGYSTTIDLIQNNATINNIELNEANTKGISSKVEPQKQQPKPSSTNKHPRDFSGQLIFV